MSRSEIIFWLAGVTLLAAILVGIWQFARTKRSQARSGDPDGQVATEDAKHAHPVKTRG